MIRTFVQQNNDLLVAHFTWPKSPLDLNENSKNPTDLNDSVLDPNKDLINKDMFIGILCQINELISPTKSFAGYNNKLLNIIHHKKYN